jgi:hypothetical protein
MGDGIEGGGDLKDMSTTRWLIDGMNNIGFRPNGWWRDRRGAIQQFTERVAEFVALSGDSATVVFDGRPFSLPAEVLYLHAEDRTRRTTQSWASSQTIESPLRSRL